jgi:nitrate reductase NapE component
MPLPQFFTSIITTSMMGKISKHMGINNRFYVNYTILLVLFVIFPTVAIFISGPLGFTLVMVLFGITGSANSISQSSSYGLGSKMPMECIAWLTTGTGISGIIINVARMVCLGIFGSEGDDAI